MQSGLVTSACILVSQVLVAVDGLAGVLAIQAVHVPVQQGLGGPVGGLAAASVCVGVLIGIDLVPS